MLPVTFSGSFELIEAELAGHCYDYVICTGLAEGRDAVSVERVAVNLIDARIPDNNGEMPSDIRIIDDGEDGIFSTLPTRKMTDEAQRIGLDARLSYSAGTYVCNYIFYRVLHHLKGSSTKAGFIHVPLSTQLAAVSGKSGMDISDITRTITEMIKAL